MDDKILSRDSNSHFEAWGSTPLVEASKKYDDTKYCALLEEGLIPYYYDGAARWCFLP
jgi:hypothetical protein